MYRARLSDNVYVYTSELMSIIVATTRSDGELDNKYVMMSHSLSDLQAIGDSNSTTPDLIYNICIICNHCSSGPLPLSSSAYLLTKLL